MLNKAYKPNKPYRPHKPNRTSFFNRSRFEKKKVELVDDTTPSNKRCWMSVKVLKKAFEDLTDEEASMAYVKSPVPNCHGWHISIDRTRSDEEIEKLYDEALELYETAIKEYELAMDDYVVAMKEWQADEVERMEAEITKAKQRHEDALKELHSRV